MFLTDRELSLVQGSFDQIAPVSDDFVDSFESGLYLLDPALNESDKGNYRLRGVHLLNLLTPTIKDLANQTELNASLRNYVRWLSAMQVQEKHYSMIGAALIRALEKQLENQWNEELKAAWTHTYTSLVIYMRTAAIQAA